MLVKFNPTSTHIQQIDSTTYEIELPGKDKVEIGDKESTDFKPHIKLNRWDGECFIKISLPSTEKVNPIVEGGKVKFGGKDIEAHFYPLELTTIDGFTQNELGGFEFEIILKKKPVSNKIVLNIETQGLKFYKQPLVLDEDVIAPDNVLGSYAVYHATRGNMHRGKADAEKYKCGKAFHIYRPKITDAVGKWVWGELNLDEQAGTLTVAVPQVFLDNAVYPVSIDPNFGYETIGGSSRFIGGADRLFGSLFNSPADISTATSVTAHVSCDTAGKYFKSLIILHSNLNIVADAIGSPVEFPTPWNASDWTTSSFSTPPSLSTTTGYVLAIIVNDGNTYLFKDDGDIDQGHYDTTNSYASPIDPTDAGHLNEKYSIYCTYEEEVGGVEKGPITSAVIIGNLVTASRILAMDRDSLVSLGNLVTASRTGTFTRAASTIIGNLVSATKSWGIAVASSIIVGNLVSAAKSWSVAVTASVIIGNLVSASRITTFTRSVSVVIGNLVTATRTIVTTRASSVIVGIVVTAARTLDVAVAASVIIGNLVTASRAITATRTASVTVGNLVTATKSWGVSIASSIIIGVVVTASKAWGVVVAASVIVGNLVTASKSWGVTVTSSVIIGVVSTASRSLAAIRQASTSIGNVVSAVGTFASGVISEYVVTAAVSIGVAVSASRVITFTRATTVLIGIVISATRVFALTRAASIVIGIAVTVQHYWEYIQLTLLSRIFGFTLKSRTLSLTLKPRSLNLTLRKR